MTRHCHICERPVEHDRDPYYVETDPGHYADEAYLVAMRNGLLVEACWSCWMKWPDAHAYRSLAELVARETSGVELPPIGAAA